jgi:uncharacterized protein (DUF2267 family)
MISTVAQSTGISDHEVAEGAALATLRVLGSQLAGGPTAALASQLPSAFAEAMPAQEPGECFDLAEFYWRAAQAEGQECTPRAHVHRPGRA